MLSQPLSSSSRLWLQPRWGPQLLLGTLPSLWFVLRFEEKSSHFPLPDRCTNSIECVPKPNRTQPQALSLRLPPDSVIWWSRHSVPWINRASWGSELLTFPGLKRDLWSLSSFSGQTGCRHEHWWGKGEQWCSPYDEWGIGRQTKRRKNIVLISQRLLG